MGAKYNNKNLRHRTWLAQNILSILPKWGFEIDEEYEENCWEFVFPLLKVKFVFICKTSLT